MQDDSRKRGFIPVLNSDFADSMDLFMVDQVVNPGKSSFPGERPLIIDYQASFSTALTVAFDSPPKVRTFWSQVFLFRSNRGLDTTVLRTFWELISPV